MFRRNLLLIGGLTAMLGAVAPAQGATPLTQYQTVKISSPDPQLKGRWGERVALTHDLTGDGVNDYFITMLHYSPTPALNFAGRVYLVNGKTGQIFYHIDSPEPQANAQFGFFINVIGDLDRDGKNDIAIGTDAQNVGPNVGQGKAWVFSGGDGHVLYALDNPAPQANARFGSRIGRAGDVTGDGVKDIIVGASNNDIPAGCGNATPVPSGCRKNQGQAFIFNGATGALVRTLDLPAEDQVPAGTCSSSCGTFGIAVQGPGDVNGDKVTDQLVDAGSYNFYTGTGTPCGAPEPNGCNEGQGRMYLFDGKTGALLRRIDDPAPQEGAVFGFQDAAPLSPGDVNQDGVADIFGNGFAQNGPAGEGDGRAWIFSGKTGEVIRELKDPTDTPGGQFAFSESSGDYNKDGVPDTYVGQAPHEVAGADENGGTYVFDGRTGALLKSLTLPASETQTATPTNGGPRLGWSSTYVGDINGDSQADFVANTPFADATFMDEGKVYAFLSTDTTRPRLPQIAGPRQTSNVRPTFRLTSSDRDNRLRELKFLCAYDGQALAPCGRKISRRLLPGRHAIRAVAIDPAGNRSTTSVIHVRLAGGTAPVAAPSPPPGFTG